MGVWAGNGDHSGHQSRLKRASELAARQHGVVSRRQLLERGISSSQIRSWRRSGRLHVTHPGVYAYGRAELGTRGRLAVALLHAGRGAALASISALWWAGLLEREPGCVHIEAPGHCGSRPGIVVRRRSEVPRWWVRDLPVVELPQALLTAAEHLGHDSLRLVLARAEFRHVLSLTSLAASLGRGRPGSSAVRAALSTHLPQLARCVSPLERDFVLLCERFELELPEPNPRIGRWRPDMLWRSRRLIVELDGGAAHGTAAQIAADRRREAALRDLGFAVMRFTWDEVQYEPALVAAQVCRRMHARPSE